MTKTRQYDRDGNRREGLFELFCDWCGKKIEIGRLAMAGGEVIEICSLCAVMGNPKKMA